MCANEKIIEPKVDSAQEFIEIAMDFSNPLDLVREAVSNAFDAQASEIVLDFSVIQEYGEKVLKIKIGDNGTGMNMDGLISFFDLGNSLRRNDEDAIGEKGHGTKVFFNSRRIDVFTSSNGEKHHAVMLEPSKELFNRKIPKVTVTTESTDTQDHGTDIIILGYNNDRREKFTHEQLKDYILWFTKFGSIEREFDRDEYKDVKLKFKGIDEKELEELSFGHIFPNESRSVSELFEKYLVAAPQWYCRRLVRTGRLKSMPEIEFQAVFSIEGNKIKYSYNDMLRRKGKIAQEGAYTVQERYGLWLCKDFMPIQRKNEWITSKGSEYTKFHAFVNCQDLRLTANRGSIDNTPSEILEDLRKAVQEIYNEIIQGDDWIDLEWLDSEVAAYNTAEKERKDFKRRIDKINRTRIAEYNGMRLVEPSLESGVFSIFMQLSTYDPDIFPFIPLDYDTHSGIDVIVKENDKLPIKSSKLYYVEFKNYLSKDFNHTFDNLYSIVCWDVNLAEIKNNDEVTDIAKQRRLLKIIPPENEGDYTRYYLDYSRGGRKIEVFVLKSYLKEKLMIDFFPRTEESSI